MFYPKIRPQINALEISYVESALAWTPTEPSVVPQHNGDSLIGVILQKLTIVAKQLIEGTIWLEHDHHRTSLVFDGVIMVQTIGEGIDAETAVRHDAGLILVLEFFIQGAESRHFDSFCFLLVVSQLG